LVPPLRPRPWPLSLVLAVFPRSASRSETEPKRSPHELPPLLQSARTWRPVLPRSSGVLPTRAQPFEGCWSLRTPLLRSLPPFSAREQQRPLRPRPESRLPGPKTSSGRGLTSAAVFRPRRFYDLDGLLRYPLVPGFPPAALLGLDSPFRVFPIREDRAVTDAASPPDLSCFGPAFAVALAYTEPVGLQGFTRPLRAEARSRIDRHRQRLVSLSPGLDPSWASLCGTTTQR